MSEEMKQVPIDLSHVFELLSNKKNDILDIDYSNDNDSYPTVRAVKNYVDDLQTILDSKASIDSVNNLGSALSSNLSTIYSFIYNCTTDKVYDNGNLTNIGTTPHSTQELINSNIDSKLGTINSKLGTIDSQLGTIDSQLGTIDSQLGTIELGVVDLTYRTEQVETDNRMVGTINSPPFVNGDRVKVRLPYMKNNNHIIYVTLIFSDGTNSGEKIIRYNGSYVYLGSFNENDVLWLEYQSDRWNLINHISGKLFSLVATSGSYNDLTDKPTIPTIPTNVSAFNNDSGFLTSHQDISGKENTSNKVTSLSSSSTDTQYPSAKCVYDTVDIVDDKVSVVYNTVSIIDTSDNLYDADRWTESGTMTIARTSKNKVIGGGGSENGYVIYNGNISNLDNYDITLNLKANRTGTNVYINDNNIGTLPTSQTSILFKKRDGVVKVVYNNNQYNASAVKFMSSNAMSMTRYTIDVVLYQGMIYDVIDSIPSKTSDLTNDSNFLTRHQDITGKEDSSNKVSSWSNTPSDDNYPSEKLVKDSLDNLGSNVNTAMTNLGSNVSTAISTVHNRISNLNTSNILSSGEPLNNIGSYSGTVQQSTINSGINTQLENINTKISSLETNKHIIEATKTVDKTRTNLTINLSYLTTITDPSVDFSPLYIKLPNDITSTTNGVRFIIKYNNGNSTFPTQQLYDMNGSSGIRENVLSANEIIIIGWDSNKLKLLKILGKEYSTVARTGSYNDLTDKPTIVDNLTTNDATKVLSAKQGKVLNDMIGDAIEYINQ